MRIYEKLVIDMDSGKVLEEVSYDYHGPIAKCDGGGDGPGGNEGSMFGGQDPEEFGGMGPDPGPSDMGQAQADMDASDADAVDTGSGGTTGSDADIDAALDAAFGTVDAMQGFMDAGVSAENASALADMGQQAATDVLGTSMEDVGFLTGVTVDQNELSADQPTSTSLGFDTGSALTGGKTGASVAGVPGALIGGILGGLFGGTDTDAAPDVSDATLGGQFGLDEGGIAGIFGGDIGGEVDFGEPPGIYGGPGDIAEEPGTIGAPVEEEEVEEENETG